MFRIDRIKKYFKVRHISFFIIRLFITLFLFLPIIVCHANSARNLINIGPVGVWNNDYGLFKEIKILEINYIQGDGETNRYAICASSTGMVIFDINNIDQPSVSSFTHIANCNDIEIDTVDLYAYVVTGEGGQGFFKIFNVQDPEKPYFVNEIVTAGNALSVAITEDRDFAYIACGEKGLQIIDISERDYLQEAGNIPDFFAQGVLIKDDYAYVIGGVLGIFNISNPADPNPVGKSDTDIFKDGLWSLAITGDYAYGSDWQSNLKIIALSDKSNPAIIGDIPGAKGDVAIGDDYAYVYMVGEGNLKIFDIGIRNFPIEVGTSDKLGIAGRVAISATDDYAYVADGLLNVIDIKEKSNPNIIKSSYPGVPRDLTIVDDYAYVADGPNGLLIIDTNNKNGLTIAGVCDTLKDAVDLDIDGNFAYVADRDRGLVIIDITDKNEPEEFGACDITPEAANTISVAVEGNYAYVTFIKDQTNGSDIRGLEIFDISDKQNPNYVQLFPGVAGAGDVEIENNYVYIYDRGSYTKQFVIIDLSKDKPPIKRCDICGGFSSGRMAISDENAYVTFLGKDPNSLDEDPNNPTVYKSFLGIIPLSSDCRVIAQELGGETSFSKDGLRMDISIKDNHAYVVDVNGDLRIIDISIPDSQGPVIPIRNCIFSGMARVIGSYEIPGNIQNIDVEGDYIYVAGKNIKLTKLKIDAGDSLKGNLILAAGGDFDPETPYWLATQSLANQVFCTFIENGYEAYEIDYHNPFFVQDIDNDGIPNQLVVDNPTPSSQTLIDSIKSAIENTNTGPLYIYLIGHGGEDSFQIMPGEVITASELKMCIDMFQDGYEDANSMFHPGTNRQVVVIIESADSGTFIDDLLDDNVTVITSTGEGASYIKPDFSDPNTPYNSFTSAFIDTNAFHAAIIPKLDPNDIPSSINDYLTEAFITARDQLEGWALEGPPFANQAPQMALPGNIYAAFYFSEDGNHPIYHLLMDQNRPYYLTIIGRDPNSNGLDPCTGFVPIDSQNFNFFSSDQDILDTNTIIEMDINGKLSHEITPKKNGRVILKGYADPEEDPDLLLSAKLIIDVSID
ncbi:MAG: LVIVD repeat-containing protein, partial [bacterium]